MSRGRRGIAARREVLILPPAALVLLSLLSIYTLLSYRSAIALLLEERQAEASQLARQLSSELVTARSLPSAEELRRRLPHASRVSLLDGSGNRIVGTTAVTQTAAEAAVGTARFKRGSELLTIQVELPAPLLRSRQRGLEVLSLVVLSVTGAITVLVLLFLRHFLAPFDRLVEKARDAGQAVPESQDEVAFLVETFEKALDVLAKPSEARPLEAGANELLDADAEMRALEKTLARSLESGVLLLDRRGAVLALNEMGASLLQVEATPTGQSVTELLHHHPQLAALLENAIRRGQPVQREECTLESADSERVLGVTAHPLRRDDSALRGFLVIFADLTEIQKEAQQRKLADSLSQLGELTAGVAHELRNSLATLRGYLTLIERGRDGESVGDYLGEIRRESDHLQRVLEDFLTFARPGSTRPQAVDLLSLLHRAAADPALKQAAITVTQTASSPTEVEPFQIYGDPQLLERALRNVLSNAVEAQRDAGNAEPVRAGLQSLDDGVEILIEDRGDGISPEIRDRVFEPFFSQRAEGVGMGLALTRRILLLHGGRIALENRSGGGARATIWIPRGNSVTLGNNLTNSLS